MKNNLAPNLLHSIDYFAGLLLIGLWDHSKTFYTRKVGGGVFRSVVHRGETLHFKQVQE